MVKSEGLGLFDHGDDRERGDRNPEIDQMVDQLEQFKDRLDRDAAAVNRSMGAFTQTKRQSPEELQEGSAKQLILIDGIFKKLFFNQIRLT